MTIYNVNSNQFGVAQSRCGLQEINAPISHTPKSRGRGLTDKVSHMIVLAIYAFLSQQKITQREQVDASSMKIV